ncbi:MAG TPA: 4Fe-4S dicluster domain-containing protein, partial [Polyangia bacterium]|nr:4Fe-4S dicluster domain-containing protein [Polyangia bacterium]
MGATIGKDAAGPDPGVCTGSKAARLADAALVQIGRRPGVADGAAGSSRRDFLSLMGFSLGAVGLEACRAPVQNAIPLPVASAEMVPGVARFYATTCAGCASSCSLLVKQRDGRPIKVDGNAGSTLFGGGSCATGQAAVLSLYDSQRLRGPTWLGRTVTWPEVDEQIAQALATMDPSKRVILLSGTITSPSTRAVVAEWARRRPRFQHIAYDPVSASGLRHATRQLWGRAVVPHYAFDRARVIVALEADFLGTWVSPVEFARAYAQGRGRRRTDAAPSLHVQVESGFSVTGSNADVRIAVAPSELGTVAAALLVRVARKAGAAWAWARQHLPDAAAIVAETRLDTIALALWQARGSSLVVSGSNDRDLQMVVAALNVLLGNIGHTVDVTRASLQRQGDDRALAALIPQMRRGEVGALFIHGANPGYDHPDAAAFLAALAHVPLSISLADRVDETGARVHAICPDHHFLESWGDAEPVEGHFSLAQPLIAPLYSTRAAPQSLLRWLGVDTSHHDWVREHWRRAIFAPLGREQSFDGFWDETLQRGTVDLPGTPAVPRTQAVPRMRKFEKRLLASVAALAAALPQETADGNANDPCCELHLFEGVALRDGRHANNPWLQELPDPITRTTWGNVAIVPPELARRMQLVSGDLVSLRVGVREITLPAFVQPGQHRRTVSVALGYGRRAAGPAGNNAGANAFPLGALTTAGRRTTSRDVVITRTGGRELLASAQTHLSSEGRPIALTITPAELGRADGEAAEPMPTLWEERPKGAHSWGLAIDLDACTGCSACVVSCQAENNVPVIGKLEVQRNRIMHWLRIDRYFDGPDDSVQSLHQPMLCQHCANAPCETVCPVLATTTSSEGLNQQVYNRCIGTRYCANNCPYKVRRFNWLEYTKGGPHASHMQEPLGRLVLNPDVTVRTRGVMEKCSLCVQRIALGKNQALQGRRALRDGDIETACQQSCPTEAI